MAGRRVALLVATDRYQDSGLSRLAAPASDARRLAAVLRDPGIAGFEVIRLHNRPNAVVGKAIGKFYRDRRRDDLTLLYFTGHGIKDDYGQLYLAMTDTDRDNLQFTGVRGEQIRLAMEGCRSRQNVLILDCCYAGAFPVGSGAKGDTAVHTLEQLGGRGSVVLTSSDATQYSFEGNHLTGAGPASLRAGPSSLFTRFLVEGLRTGRADLDGDGNITLDELYSYVHDRVTEEQPQQRPKKKEDVEGRILFAWNVRWTLPSHISNVVSGPYAVAKLTALEELRGWYNGGNTIVQQRILETVRMLAEDDSKSVSEAANQFLSGLVLEKGRQAEEQAEQEARDAAARQAEEVAAVATTPSTAIEPDRSGPDADVGKIQPVNRRRRRGTQATLAGLSVMAVAAIVVAVILMNSSGHGPSTSDHRSSTAPWVTATSAAAGGGRKALIAAAKKEGTLNVIALPPTWANYDTIIKDFTKTYGIKVNSANPDATSQAEVDAVKSENGTAKAPDVLDLGKAVALNTNLFAPYKVSTWSSIPAAQKDPSGLWYQDYGGYMSIGYDSARFGTITSVSQLLGKKFRNAVALNGNPTEAYAALSGVMMANLAEGGTADNIAKGVAFFHKLKQAGNYVPVQATAATIEAGTTPVVFNWDYLSLPPYVGMSTWKVFVPSNAILGGYYAQAINKNAPHPAAARLWEEFLYSQAATGGQNRWLEGGARPVEQQAMTSNGTINPAAAAKLPTVSGKPVFLTETQATNAANYLAANWANAVG